MKKFFQLVFTAIFFTTSFFSTSLMAQTAQDLVKKSIQEQQTSIVDDFKTFLSIPNVASNPKGLQENAQWIMNYMKAKGIEDISVLTLPNSQMPPVVYGEVKVPGATETIIFYAHYDGQPVDTSKWFPGLHPFKPRLYSGMYEKEATVMPWLTKGSNYDMNARIYARGASDDKAGVMAIINAYAQLKALHIKPTVNIKFFFEGEEEAGSPNLEAFLELYKNKLAANFWIICDGPVHQSGKKQLVMGVRGDTHLELTVFGPKRPLHSGHYGNWVLNPAMELARLLASMKNEKGEVFLR
jgi:acetylornithine deacetylase/succinyl-diaminopimelate desuccinylase-like protein